jgi:hypothetical protein
MLTNVTLGQLIEEAPVRWPTLWDESVERTICLVLLPRKSRPEMEQHGFFVEHKHPVFAMFYRPRDEANTIRANGIDPLSASYQFLNIAVSDLGVWMTDLVINHGYELTKTLIEPLPANVISTIRLGFEAFEITTYTHNSLDYFERLPLVMPPTSLVSKAFLSIPDIVPTTPIASEPQEISENISEENIETTVKTIPQIEVISEASPQQDNEISTPTTTNNEKSSAPRAIIEEQATLPGVGVEAEFRTIVQKLMGDGLDHQEMMENEEFQDISDRATAAGVNTWELFLKLAT